METKEQLEIINIIKGIGILLVLIGHFNPTVSFSNEGYDFLHRVIYSFHMPLFMLVSGFLYSFNKKEPFSYSRFVKRKAFRLIIPYFSWCMLILIFKFAGAIVVKLQYPIQNDFLYRIFVCPLGGYATFLWFIYTLFLILLIYPLLEKWMNSVVLTLICFAIFFIPLPVQFSLNLVGYYLLFFHIGSILHKHGFIFKIQKFTTIIQSGLSVLCLIFLDLIVGFGTDISIVDKWLAFVKAILGISVVLFLSTVVCKTEVGLKKVFLKIGVYSAAIYLLHTFTMAIFRLPAEKYIGYTPVSFYIIGLLSVVGGTILAMLLTKYVIRKWKSLKFLLLGE